MSDDTIDRLTACLWSSEQRNERLRDALASRINDVATVRDCLLRDGEELRQSLALEALDRIERALRGDHD